MANVWASPTVYRYRDENGQWVMTDRKPATQDHEQQRLLVTESRQQVAVVNRGTAQRPVLYAINPLGGPVEIGLEFLQHDNVRFSHPAPYLWLVPAMTEQFVLQLEAEVPDKGLSYQWRYHATPGPPVMQERLAPVVLPVVPFLGGPFGVSQGFMGTASHAQSPQSEYAVDFALPLGTPIVAAQAGVVMDVERHFSRAGWDEALVEEANFVRLLHDDGIMTVYAHLAADTIDVVPGQTVQAGQRLGKSGNTGFSSGPHLHFVVQINAGQPRQLVSMPFRFHSYAQPPREGDAVRGRPL